MRQKLARITGRLFPERQILIRSRGEVTQLTLPSAVQMAVVAVALIGTGAAAADWVVQARNAEQQQQAAVQALQAELAATREAADSAASRVRQLAAETGTRKVVAEQAAADAAKLADKVQRLEGDLQAQRKHSAETRSMLEMANQQLENATSEELKLKAEHDKLANERGKLQSKVGELEQAKAEAEKEKIQKEKALAEAERNARDDQARLRQKVVELEQKLARAEVVSAPAPAPAAGAAPTTAAFIPAADTASEALPENAPARASNSFNLAQFLGRYGIGMRQADVGGPYVAVGSARSAGPLTPEAQQLLKTLPLTAPLDHYQEESGFGTRTDPFNGHQSMHTGLDLSAPYKSPVYNTAPGTVVFAGFAAAYGKMVEIDHGMGIHTRYAHLNRIMVNVGERLSQKTEVGLLGSTGRSTGPHVHYEVVVNGVAQDPEKFLEAGKSVMVKAAP